MMTGGSPILGNPHFKMSRCFTTEMESIMIMIIISPYEVRNLIQKWDCVFPIFRNGIVMNHDPQRQS